jgi:glycosyltransferase involved in cell wall biosynthesis
VRTIHSISQDVPQGISVAQIAPIVAKTPKREKFTIYYGGRFSGSKRLADIAELVDKFYAFGRDVQFVVTTGSLDGMKRAKFEAAYPQVELHVGKSQEEAWALMAGCHASFCFSSHELFGMAFWEQMAAGLGVVMLAKEWNRELMPPGHLLVADTPSQAAAHLRLMHERWQESDDHHLFERLYGWHSSGAQWVRENYDADRNLGMLADDLIGRVRSIEADAAVKFEQGKAASLQEALETVLQGEVLTLRDLWAGIREHSRVGTNFIGKRMTWPKSNSYLDALRLARWLGWEDCFVNGEAAIRKAV